MAAFINTNIASLNAQNNLNKSQGALATSLQRLSSGLRINSAKDDSAGLAISERLTSQIKGNDQAARNANDGISLTQTAEGALTTISDNLQRMRELSVQAANGSNSASDRASIDNEVQSLSQEIDRVAQNSSFNGNKLLDGSFTSQNIQVGANATVNDTIAVSIGSARTSTLGGVGVTNAASLKSGLTTAALVAGDLTLNGFQVGASALGAAPGQSTASAFSIANAINAVSAESGVTATANSNVVAGSGPTAGAIAANAFSINGVNVGAVTTGTNAAGQGANVAAAINKIATQTGVTATADATSGALTLTAADGRSIKLSLNVVAGATTATTQKANLAAKTGIAAANIGAVGTTTIASGAFTAPASTTVSDRYAVKIDGISLFNDAVGNASAANLDSAFTAFAAANTGYSLSGTFAAGTAQITKTDGSAVTINQAVTDTTGTGPAAGTISGGSTLFGAAAPTVAAGVAGFSATTAAGNFGATAGANALANNGTVSLSSTSASGIVLGGANAGNAGFTAGTIQTTVTSSAKSIASINVLTAANAASALTAIDGALATVNASKASLGVFQNRFASVVSNLQSTSENLTASRSRIQDTDFAKETASLTRGQILQQAGTAMLAQANSLPNGVLALLRG